MRLIDADEARKIMCHKCNENFPDDPCEPSDCIFVNAIKDTPTAYDVEAVVRELEEEMEDCMKSAHICDDMDDYEGAVEWSRKAGAFRKAIEIVRRGGRNE